MGRSSVRGLEVRLSSEPQLQHSYPQEDRDAGHPREPWASPRQGLRAEPELRDTGPGLEEAETLA